MMEVLEMLREIQRRLEAAPARARVEGDRAVQRGIDRYVAQAGYLMGITEVEAERLADVIQELERIATHVANPRS